MSRNELPEKSPEGIDDQTWFYLHETLRKFDSAIGRLDVGLANALSSSTLVRPTPVAGFCTAHAGRLVANAAGTEESATVTVGQAGGGSIEVSVQSWPTGEAVLSTVLEPGTLDRHLLSRWTFAGAAGTFVGQIGRVRTSIAVPRGFTGWSTNGIRVLMGFSIAGASVGSTMTVTLSALANSTTATVTAGPFAVAAGTIADPYGTTPLILTAQTLAPLAVASAQAILLTLNFTCTSTTSSSAILDVGKFEFNWE